MLISLEGISKSFPGVQALRDVSLACAAGEVHALLGENGAGKSTLMKILAGAERPDTGRIVVEGKPVRFGSPRDAQDAGISIIYQEFNLLPELTVLENIYLGREHRLLPGLLDWRGMARDATATLWRLGIALDLGARVGNLSVAQQQLVEITRALSRQARLVIMDEPSTVLAGHELEHLFATIGTLRAQGVGIIYISHRLEEVFRIADQATVLRDGVVSATVRPAETTREELVRLMVGRELRESQRPDAGPGAPILEVRDLYAAGFLRDISFQVRRGEIVGLAGLVGAGRTTLARTLFGLERLESGRVDLDGQPIAPRQPAAAMRAGLALVPEDRKGQGLVLNLSVSRNISLPNLAGLRQGLLLSRARHDALVGNAIHDLAIKTPGHGQEVRYLSGGNQQKVVLAKWLATRPKLLILDEPTRGVDVGAKAEIYHIIRRLAAEGTAILLISSDLPELLALAGRILVMHEGSVTGNLPAAEATEESILSLALGEQPGPITG